MYFVKYGGAYLHDPRSDDETLLDLEIGIELNTCGYCTFTIAPNHPRRGLLRERDAESPVEVYDGETLVFSGYVWELGTKFELTGEVSCKGELAYLADSLVRPYSTVPGAAVLQAPSTVDGYFAWLIDQHNAHVSSAQQFVVGANQGAALVATNHLLRASSQLPTTAEELQAKLLDGPGGYVFARHGADGLRYIDYLSECVDVNAQVIDFGENLLDYTRTDSCEKLYTCIRPTGGTPEGGEGEEDPKPVTVEGLPDGPYERDAAYVKQGDRVVNVEASLRYGLIELEWGESEALDPKNLLEAAVVKLKEYVEPKTTIEVKAVDAALYRTGHEPLRAGQLVRVRSRPHAFDSYMLVSKIEPNLSDPEKTAYTLGTTYDSLTGETNKQIRKLNAAVDRAVDAMAPIDQAAKDAAEAAGEAKHRAQEAIDRLADLHGTYVHVRWSESADGAGMSDAPGPYMGVCSDNNEAAPADPAAYAWVKVQGDEGVRGDDGADGRPSYLHVKWSAFADGDPMSETPGPYMGTYVDDKEADPADYRLYTWARVKGDRGLPGPHGADGKQLYTWLKYADTPTSGMSDSPTGKAYMGLAYNRATATESSNYADYSWSLVKGVDGVPGPAGSDGKQLYTWVKYATSPAGADMSDSPAGRTHIGLAYNKTTATESADPADYTWSLIKGDKGDQGAPGRGIESTTVTYQAGASGTAAPAGAWSTTIPAVAANQYLWTRIAVVYTDGGSSTAYSVGKIGANGATGAPGKPGANGAPGTPGRGVKSTAVAYQAGASGTAAPTGAWAPSPPGVAADQYLWTRITITYTDDATSTAYSVGKMGAQGPPGATGPTGPPGAPGRPGAAGADGKTLYGASNTASAAAAKATASNIAGFSLYVGVAVAIKFTYANSAPSPSLNVNATGAKPIRLNGVSAAYWQAGATVGFTYDGAYWQTTSTPLYGATSTIGNPAGANVYSDGAQVAVRQGATVLARFKAGLLELASNSVNAVIRLCGGKGTISYYAATDQLAIMAPGSIGVMASYTTAAGDVMPYDAGLACNKHGALLKGNVEISGGLRLSTATGAGEVADWVVAQGTTGAWYWRKWAGGIAELDGYGGFWSGGFPAWQWVYCSANMSPAFAYPFPLRDVHETATVESSDGVSVWASFGTAGTSAASSRWYACRATPAGNSQIIAHIHAVGRWK